MNATTVHRTIRSTGIAVILALVGWLQAGCQTTADLQPAPGATDVAGLEEAARSTVEGVRVLTGQKD